MRVPAAEPLNQDLGGSGGGVTMAAVGGTAHRPSASGLGRYACGRFQCAPQRRIGQKLFVPFIDRPVQGAPVAAHGVTLAQRCTVSLGTIVIPAGVSWMKINPRTVESIFKRRNCLVEDSLCVRARRDSNP